MEEILEDAVKKHRLGATINLFVTPDARSNVFPTGVDEWRKSIEISVKSPAQYNRANIDSILLHFLPLISLRKEGEQNFSN